MADLPTHIKVALPALSPTMEMGTIVNWEKKVGDQVSEGDLLCEIETDKATMGFETPEEGYLAKIMLEAGSKDIPVGKLLCIIVENAEDVAKFADFVDDGKSASSAPPAAAPAPKEAAAPPPPPSPAAAPAPPPPSLMAQSTSGDRPFASPAAKRLAAERGLDLFQIKSGSGMDGMITSRDVENFKGAPAAAPAAGFPAAMPLGGGFPTGDHMVYTDADTTNMRKIIAKRLQQSKHEIPHYYLTVECNMDDILKFRSEINKTYEKEGVKLSVNDFIIKATALASKRVPQCNSAWMDSYIREYHTCDVSIAVDTGNGLITPIVTNVESRGLADISETVKELAGRAKEGKLQPHEFQGGSITVSNLGMFGIKQFTAIINPPQACILAVGGTEKKVVVGKGGEPVVSSMMRVTMSCDHRVVDGAVGAQWLAHFKKFMENPQAMLL
jgi:pyruvate dehydrogenase E2 component (dihydrolipoamide acetyltransferase)